MNGPPDSVAPAAGLEPGPGEPPGVARWILRGTALLILAFLAWCSVGRVDVVAIAPGRTVTSGHSRVVQAPDGGVVRLIRVREGQGVRQGEPLLEFDATIAGARLRQIEDRQGALETQRAILNRVVEALRSGGTAASPGRTGAELVDTGDRAAWLAQQQLQARLDEYRTGSEALRAEWRRQLAEKRVLEEQLSQLDAALPMIRERARASGLLHGQGMLPRMHWLEIEEQRLRDEAEHSVTAARIASAGEGAQQALRRSEQFHADFAGRALAELAGLESELTQLRHERQAAARLYELNVITAPVSGIVHDLRLHTTGGRVAGGEVLLSIVPQDEPIEIEARVANADAGHVHPGLPAVVKFAAFPYTRHGTLSGRLVSLSADAKPDEALGLVYVGRVVLDMQSLTVNGRPAALLPGMAVTVEFKLGRRRIIEFLLDPLLRHHGEAFREI